jgi:hypothetical protein
MIKTLTVIAATTVSLLALNTTAIAQDAAAKTGHVTLMKRCDTGSCDAETAKHAINTKGTGGNKSTGAGKKDYVGHVTLNKRTVAPNNDIPGCGPTQYGNPTSSTC